MADESPEQQEDVVEDEEDRDIADTLKASVHSLVALPFVILAPLLTAVPPAWKVYHKLHKWSAWQMQKASRADSLANVRLSNGKEEVLPAKFVEGGEDDRELSGWRVKGLGGKRFDTAVHGRSASRIGKADIIHINEDDTEQGTWAEAAIDNAFQLDREQYLFRDAEVTIDQLVYDYNGQQAGAAVTDGGAKPTHQVQTQDVALTRPGVLEDVLVPLGSRNGYDGQVVSWSQYSNLKSEQSDQETIRDAKNQAWAAAKLDDVEGMDVLKWALIIGGWSALLLFKDSIAAFIAGLGGGDAVGQAASGAGLGMINLLGTLPSLGVM